MTAVLTEQTDRSQADPRARGGRWIDDWEPENDGFWQSKGRRVAWRNLGFSIFAEHISFNVWLLMSIVVVNLSAAGIDFTVGQAFFLLIMPNLVGAALRIPYTFAAPKFGGRAWTTFSVSLLLVPCAMLLHAVTSAAPYWFFLLTATVLGAAGATFSSSMANIQFFFPESKKGLALGLNAAGGNIGAAVAQLVVPVVISLGTGINLAYAAVMWMPLIVLAAACAWFKMDSVTAAKPDGASYRLAVRAKHTWIAALLYVGSFGTFIGFAFAFPLLIGTSFPEYESFVGLAFLGALISALCRPVGGYLADKLSGARITLIAFAGMACGAVAAMVGIERDSFALFFASFMVMFVLTGLGNGAVYRMIPSIFSAEARRQAAEAGCELDAALRSAKRQAGAVIGLTGSIGAFGGVLVNLVFRFSLNSAGTLTPALIAFLVFYGICMVTVWWFYLRTTFAVSRAPSLAYAQI